MCCMDGKVELPPIQRPTEAILKLLFKNDFDGMTFRKYIRSFNNGLCLSSLQFNQRQFKSGNYKPIVIEGSVHQFFGSLKEKEAETPRFAQLWIHDPGMETTTRVQNMNLPSSMSIAEEEAVRRVVEILQVKQRLMYILTDFHSPVRWS